MRQDRTALERAFELADAGQCKSIDEIKSLLKGEGYWIDAIVGRQLFKQLRDLIARARKS
jgi:hypothetical protein